MQVTEPVRIYVDATAAGATANFASTEGGINSRRTLLTGVTDERLDGLPKGTNAIYAYRLFAPPSLLGEISERKLDYSLGWLARR